MRRGRRLPAQDRLFPRQAPMVAGERAGAAEHPVARDHERNRVACRPPRRPPGTAVGLPIRRAMSEYVVARSRGIRRRVCQTRTSKSVPIRTTRSGCSACHRAGSKIRSARGAGGPRLPHKSPSASGRCRSASAASWSPESTKPRPASPRSVAISTGFPERRGVEPVAHGQALAARLEVARGHRLVGDEKIVQPRRARKAKLVGRVKDAGGIGQQRLSVVEGDGLQEGLGRQPAPAPKQVVHMRGRQARMVGDRLQRGLVAPALRDIGDDSAHMFVIGRGAGRLFEGGGFDGDAAQGV